MGEKPNLPTAADIGYRANNALIAHEENVIIPADATEQVQYEAEVVYVIGKKIKNASREEALNSIFGYTIGNDVSERTWQKSDRTFFRSKNTDTFKPMGPWIETDFDINVATTTVRVNGQETISFATKDMIFDFADFLSRASKYITFYPGDVMWMGTERHIAEFSP
jgi:2-keto-4-pentenoate hydratase/2-oxohepta-3-ene-1,7-dioic acid hydratase in catechol pathway